MRRRRRKRSARSASAPRRRTSCPPKTRSRASSCAARRARRSATACKESSTAAVSRWIRWCRSCGCCAKWNRNTRAFPGRSSLSCRSRNGADLPASTDLCPSSSRWTTTTRPPSKPRSAPPCRISSWTRRRTARPPSRCSSGATEAAQPSCRSRPSGGKPCRRAGWTASPATWVWRQSLSARMKNTVRSWTICSEESSLPKISIRPFPWREPIRTGSASSRSTARS